MNNSRDIKFRGFPKNTDKQEIVYGWGCYTDENERQFIIVSLDEFIQVKQIEQYLGIKDKTGKEIYSGSRVKGELTMEHTSGEIGQSSLDEVREDVYSFEGIVCYEPPSFQVKEADFMLDVYDWIEIRS